MKTRILSLLLAVILTAALTGCGKNQKTETPKPAGVQTAAQTAEKPNPAAENKTAAQSAEPAAQTNTEPPVKQAGADVPASQTAGTASEPVLFQLDTDDFTLIIHSMAESTGHPFFGDYYEFPYTFVNKTDKKVEMDWNYITVCHYSMPQAVGEWAEPGETLKNSFCLMKVFPENCGVESPDEVYFRLEVRNDEEESADPFFYQYVSFWPTGKTAADIPPADHPLTEKGIVLADTEEFCFVLIPEQMEEGISTHFRVLLTNKTGNELRFRWSEVEANGYSVADYIPEDEYFLNGTLLPPHSQEVNYLEVVIGALMHLGSPVVDQLAFRLEVFDHALTEEEIKLYSETLSLFPTGKAPEEVDVPAVPEMPEQKVLFEDDDITLIILDEFQIGRNVRYLTVYAENRSGKDATVYLHDITLDDRENWRDEALLLLAGKSTLQLLLLDPTMPQEDPERGPEEIAFRMDIRLTDAEGGETVLVKDAEFTFRFSEVLPDERLPEGESSVRYDTAP